VVGFTEDIIQGVSVVFLNTAGVTGCHGTCSCLTESREEAGTAWVRV